MPLVMQLGGWRPDPAGEWDCPFRFLRPRLDPRVQGDNFELPERTPIGDQGSIGSCVGNAVCDAFEQIMPGRVVQLSRLFVYYNARVAIGQRDIDGGCHIRDALSYVSHLGVPPESEWPYEERRVFDRPAAMAYVEADAHRLGTFYRIQATGRARLDDIVTALRSGHPVIFGTQVGKEWFDYRPGKPAVGVPERPQGGHAQVIVGVRDEDDGRAFKIRNSWSRDWGDDGCGWMRGDYLADEMSSDFWVPTAALGFDGT